MSDRFTFRFETLLKLRARAEDEAKRAVGRRMREIIRLEDRRLLLERRIVEETREIRFSLTGGRALDVDHVRQGRHWLARLRQGVLTTDAEIATQRAVLAQERAALFEARKRARILETVRDRQYLTFAAQLRRREQREQDEMNVTRFAHAMMREEGEKA